MSRFNQRHILIISVFTTLLLMAGSAQAQAQYGNRAGFFIGLNFANQGDDMEMMGQMLADELELETGDSWSSSKGSITGLGLGGYYTIQTSPTFGVQIEGQYIRRGSKLDLEGSDGISSITFETEFQINYMEFPILARFSPNQEATFRPVIMLGPVIGFKTGADLKISFEGESASQSMSDDYKTTTFGLLGSLGFSAQVGKTSFLSIQARYYKGLTNPIDDPELVAKSQDFGIFVGMEFLLNN